MASSYPGSLDAFATNRANSTSQTTTHPADHNNLADAVNKIEATLGVDPQGDFSTVVERLDSPVIQMVSTNISAAQLIDLDNTPVELLPAPGGRNYYLLHSIVFHYRFVTTPYNEGGAEIGNSFVIFYGSTNPATVGSAENLMRPLALGGSPLNTRDLFKQTEDSYIFVIPENAVVLLYEWTASTIEDKPLSVGFVPTFSASLTGGDSTLTIRTFYSLINGASSS